MARWTAHPAPTVLALLFATAMPPSVSAAPPAVEAVSVFASGRSAAIVTDGGVPRVVGVGGTVGGRTVVAVTPEGVLLSGGVLLHLRARGSAANRRAAPDLSVAPPHAHGNGYAQQITAVGQAMNADGASPYAEPIPQAPPLPLPLYLSPSQVPAFGPTFPCVTRMAIAGPTSAPLPSVAYGVPTERGTRCP